MYPDRDDQDTIEQFCPRFARGQCMTKFKMKWSWERANVTLTFEFRISGEAKSKVVEQMLPSIFLIPCEFLFYIEIMKALYYISYG